MHTMEANYKLKISFPDNFDLLGIVKFSKNGKWIASCTTKGVVEIWGAHDGKFHDRLSGHNEGIKNVAWSDDSLSLLTAGSDNDLKLWNSHRGKYYRTFKGHRGIPTCCNFNRTSSLMVSGSLDGTVIMWDVRTANRISVLSKHSDKITSVEFSSEGSEIMTTSYDGMCRIWDTGSGQLLKRLNSLDDQRVFFAKFSPNGKQLLMARPNTLKLWDFAEDKWVKTYTGHRSNSHFVSAAFSHDSKWIVSGSEDHHVYIWNANTAAIAQELEAHTDVVMGVDCHPSSYIIASAGIESDNTVKVWQHYC